MIFILIFHTGFIPKPCIVEEVITRKYIQKREFCILFIIYPVQYY